MKSFKKYLENKKLDDLFGQKSPRKEIQRQPKTESITIQCYRGFPESSLKRDLISSGPGWYKLSPSRAMEGILWFTNELQRGTIDPVEYASGYAQSGYLLTYPLKAKKHYIDIQYEPNPDYWNHSSQEAPEDLISQINGTEKCRFRQLYGSVYELPEGWFFTWQMEKHIGTDVDLLINENMLQKID